MSGWRFSLLLALVSFAGLVGGALSNVFLVRTPLFVTSTNEPSKTLRTEKLEIVDKHGRTLGTFEAGRQGPSVNLFDTSGELRAQVDVYQIDSYRSHTRMSLFDKNKTVRARLAVVQEDQPIISLYDKDGKIIWETPLKRK